MWAFDLIELDGEDLRRDPLRQSGLERVVAAVLLIPGCECERDRQYGNNGKQRPHGVQLSSQG
jgi:ATP-dependent DNA ligase